MHEADPNGPSARIVAGLLGAVFIVMQLWTVDYGTRLNDADAVRQFSFASGAGAAMEERLAGQENVISRTRAIAESAEKKMLRFKLYSVNPDEPLSIMALRRIRPGRLDFNPDLFQYGGGFLYPLGIWYFALSKLGVVEISSLDAVLKSPDGLDRVYVAGRIFIIIAFVLSAWLLYRALRLVTEPWTATWALGIYLFAPIPILYSMIIKPHWYWLLWICAAMLVFTQGWVRGRFAGRDEILLGIFIGLVVGTEPINGVPALLAGAAILVAVRQGIMRPAAIVLIPLIAVFCAFLASPYFVLGWRQVIAKSSANDLMPEALAGPIGIWNFLSTSLPLGFGIAVVVLAIGLGLYRLIAGKGPMTWYAAACLGAVVVVVGYVAASRDSPLASHARFAPYLLPLALLMVVHRPWPYRRQVMAAVFALTVIQSIPTKFTQIDADDPLRGTRFALASWIETRLPPGTSLCSTRASIGPTNMPPVDYTRYPTPQRDCDYLVARSTGEDVGRVPPGYRLTAEFAPRLWAWRPVAVYGVGNPYFGLYARAGAPDPQ